MDIESSDEATAYAVKTLRLPESALQDLTNELKENNAFQQAKIPDHLASLATGMYKDSWFCAQGANDLAATGKGTRPGDPFGDLAFNFLMR